MVDLGRGFTAYRFYPCVVKKTAEFLDTNHGRYWKWDKDHFQTVNTSYGAFHNDQDKPVRSDTDKDFKDLVVHCDALSSKKTGYLEEFEKMTSNKPCTPWSTSNSEYGKNVDTGKRGPFVNYRTQAITGVSPRENYTAPNVAKETFEAENALKVDPSDGDIPGEMHPNLQELNLEATQNAEKTSLEQNEPGVDPQLLTDGDQVFGDVQGMSNQVTAQEPVAAAVRLGLPSRGPARRFMQEQCGRLLDSIQTLRGAQDASAGRVQVLVVDHEPLAENVEVTTKNDFSENNVTHRVPSTD